MRSHRAGRPTCAGWDRRSPTTSTASPADQSALYLVTISPSSVPASCNVQTGLRRGGDRLCCGGLSKIGSLQLCSSSTEINIGRRSVPATQAQGRSPWPGPSLLFYGPTRQTGPVHEWIASPAAGESNGRKARLAGSALSSTAQHATTTTTVSGQSRAPGRAT